MKAGEPGHARDASQRKLKKTRRFGVLRSEERAGFGGILDDRPTFRKLLEDWRGTNAQSTIADLA